MNKEISILILTYNAPEYVKKTIESLNNVTDKELLKKCEIIVWDNCSDSTTKNLLNEFKNNGLIDKLHFSSENLLFAGGNNSAARLANSSSKYYLLLNSDILIKDKHWLNYLLYYIKKDNIAGVSYGFCKYPDRCDGYCLLIDRALYDKYELDTQYQWWWGVTKLQAEILKEGYSLIAIYHHNHILYHYGGKSGNAFKNAKGMNTTVQEVIKWFKFSKGQILTKSAIRFGNIFKYFMK
ncbi:MAG: glycosyltransferase [Bacteroides sp.]|nr:glycosyltransferase [Bacteroides sp.]